MAITLIKIIQITANNVCRTVYLVIIKHFAPNVQVTIIHSFSKIHKIYKQHVKNARIRIVLIVMYLTQQDAMNVRLDLFSIKLSRFVSYVQKIAKNV